MRYNLLSVIQGHCCQVVYRFSFSILFHCYLLLSSKVHLLVPSNHLYVCRLFPDHSVEWNAVMLLNDGLSCVVFSVTSTSRGDCEKMHECDVQQHQLVHALVALWLVQLCRDQRSMHMSWHMCHLHEWKHPHDVNFDGNPVSGHPKVPKNNDFKQGARASSQRLTYRTGCNYSAITTFGRPTSIVWIWLHTTETVRTWNLFLRTFWNSVITWADGFARNFSVDCAIHE